MMSTLTLNSSSDSMTLSIPKLRDDGSNWSDYEPCIQRAMGSKGLWRHIEGTAIAPKLYALDHGILVLSDGKMPATDEQIEATESKIMDFDKQEYLAQHVILSTTSTHLGSKIRLAAVRFPNLPNLVQTRFGTGVQGSGSAEYLNPNLLWCRYSRDHQKCIAKIGRPIFTLFLIPLVEMILLVL